MTIELAPKPESNAVPKPESNAVPEKFIVERGGRRFVLYAGLLDLAHKTGLQNISTSLIQAPSAENERVAICAATVVMRTQGADVRTFAAIGDASPDNAAPAMHTCLIRMAETRAKARALRDAVNVAMVAYDELPPAQKRPRPQEDPPAIRMSTSGAAGRCPDCKATKPEPGPHHRPDCPQHKERGAA